MNWTVFRELPPLERRKKRRSWSHLHRARDLSDRKAAEASDRNAEANLDKYPELHQAWDLSLMYAFAQMPTELDAWFHSRPDGAGTETAPIKLLRLGRKFPAAIFGFFNEEQQFVPGILPRMARRMDPEELYTDPLDEILSEENLSGKTLDEVVAMAAARGMGGCNYDVARKRVVNWDRTKPETSQKKSHPR